MMEKIEADAHSQRRCMQADILPQAKTMIKNTLATLRCTCLPALAGACRSDNNFCRNARNALLF